MTLHAPEELRHSPLDAEHRSLGARMVGFGGWDMPIQYTGVLAEHRACRETAVVFDVSHLGSLRVSGRGALELLQRSLTNDLGRIAPGRAQYTHLLDADDGHVVDDIIVWWVGEDDFIVMPNASNTERITAALADGEATVTDITAERAVLAVQGPEARARLRAIAPDAADVARFAVQPFAWDGHTGFVAGTGYTGEDGVELHVPVGGARSCWQALVGEQIVPAGLGARDTLRLEAGLPLHGHELGPGITPLQAALGWVVRFDKGDFRGRDALQRERDAGVARRLRGLAFEGRQFPRAGYPVQRGDTTIGEVTSGNFSPVLGHGIALAFLPTDACLGERVDVDVRGRRLAATVVDLPFVSGSPARG
ncbi:MAG TPA: glycine cleavage system aminomethyltransferase GcvT [Acidimicrobiia bacterium]|nr:glycine cleavage system aminomethyltransferase GcvT [Acidimicrobiia bacterium]